MSGLELYLIFDDKSKFWPLDACHIAELEILGRPIYKHLVNSVLSFTRLKKIIVFGSKSSYNRDKISGELGEYGVDVDFEDIKDITYPSIIEVVNSIRDINNDMLISLAYDPAVILAQFPWRCIENKSTRSIGYTERLLLYVKSGEEIGGSIKKIGVELINLPRYPWELLTFSNILAKEKITKRKISKTARISGNVSIIGNCWIDDDVKIFENAVIKGPCYIGKNTVIGNNVLIRETIIERDSIIGANMEVARSWLGIHTETHSGYIGDTIFDFHVHVGAGFITGNVRLDRRTIKVRWQGEKIDSGMNKLGPIIGSKTEVGIHSGTMPGVLIGKNVVIGPGTLVFENIPDNTIIYARQEIVKKKRVN